MQTIWKAVASTLALAASMGAAQGETLLRLSTYVNESDIRYQGMTHFAKLVGEKTNGSVKVELFPSSTLHGWSEGIDALQGGISDMSWLVSDARLPCYTQTYFYPAEVSLTNQIALDAAFNDLVRDELGSVGLVPIMNSNYSYDQEWWFREPGVDLAKLDGKLVRSIGPLVSQMIEAWGGAPVFVSPKEVFQSAERGVVDGINMGVATYSSWKLWTVMPHMINANLFYGNTIYAMNQKKFDSLTAEEQTAVREAARETETWLQPRYEAFVDQAVGNAVMLGGGSATTLPAKDRAALIASVSGAWNEQVDKACGPDLGKAYRALLASHAP
ncbi:MAG: TRAP transporter substrate-binding protein DctP [Gemmobacter sp.]